MIWWPDKMMMTIVMPVEPRCLVDTPDITPMNPQSAHLMAYTQ